MSMKKVEIDKVTLNIGCAGDLEKIERAKKLLQMLTNQRPCVTISKKRSTFGIASGKPVGVKVTLRKEKAYEFLKKAFKAIDNKLDISRFDRDGNFSFGIREYIEIPGIKYSHEVGLLGMDVCVTMKRPGYRVKHRKRARGKIGKKHKITKEEVIDWLKEKFGVEVE
jgi:large subunit ribosomal protein L5